VPNYHLNWELIKAESKSDLTIQQIANMADVSKNTVMKSQKNKGCQEAKARAMFYVFKLPKSFKHYSSVKPFKDEPPCDRIGFREWEVTAEISRREISRGIPFHVFKSENSLTKGRFARTKQFFLQSLNEEEIQSAKKYALPRHAEVCLKLKGNTRFPAFIDLGLGDDGTFWSLDEWEEGKTVRALVEEHNEFIQELEKSGATKAELEKAESRFDDQIPNIAFETLRALSDLHQHGIVMRLLSPESVFRTENGVIQIRDFELSKIDTVESEPFDWHRSVYLASEVDTGNVDARTDIRSWAAVVMFLILRRDPLGNPKEEVPRLKIKKKEVATCLARCCEIPSDRPSVQDALDIIGKWAGK